MKEMSMNARDEYGWKRWVQMQEMSVDECYQCR